MVQDESAGPTSPTPKPQLEEPFESSISGLGILTRIASDSDSRPSIHYVVIPYGMVQHVFKRNIFIVFDSSLPRGVWWWAVLRGGVRRRARKRVRGQRNPC